MNIDELTPAWLSQALGRQVDDLTATPVGTGQIGTCYRLALSGSDVPASLLAKLPAPDPGTRDLLANVYRTELRFYSLIAPTVDVRVPASYYSEMAADSGDFTLLLEDLAPREQGDQLAGCSVGQARDAVVNLAGLHGPRWCDPTLLDVEGLQVNGPEDASLMAELYGPATDIFVDGLAALLSDEDVVTLRRVVEIVEAWALARAERFGLVHGDYRLDNLMFPPGGGDGVVALDWQTLSLALPARDLAYFLSTGLSVEDRQAHERELVAAYHSALAAYAVDGSPLAGYSLEECWEDYRFAMVQGPLVSVFGCAYGTRTERGDRMFAAMVARSCAAIRDLDTLALVPGQ
ncbi:phosphotransferase family protein [Nocardioides sp. URHA0020]|uniref:phosphotransferase family protein n=1 Tax=Nocardioides sp. URHA0020 TaxID=1380392 RepID=UPI00048DA4E4|nr:phosphotransferase [Nocardioides sp. URHA0020]